MSEWKDSSRIGGKRFISISPPTPSETTVRARRSPPATWWTTCFSSSSRKGTRKSISTSTKWCSTMRVANNRKYQKRSNRNHEETTMSISRALLPVAALFALVCALFTTFNAAAQETDPASMTVTLKKGDVILFFGDSLTELAGREAPKEHVTKGYVRIVREKLAETYKDKNLTVEWVATGGHTVPDLLKRVDKDVIAKMPSIVFIQIGCNDARRIPKETFQEGLEELIDKLQAAGIQVIQCSLTSVGEKHDGTNKDDPKLDEFAQIEREVAKKKKVPLNDLRKAFAE